MARAIDSEAAYRFLSEQLVKETGAFSKGVNKGLNIARSAMRNPDAIPTLTQPNEPRAGLYGKYTVYKNKDGSLVTDCFILRPAKDPAAVAALRAYAAATDNAELAADIINWVGAEPNESLTIEQLLKMDGEPVYVVFRPDNSGDKPQFWALVSADKQHDEVYLLDSMGGAGSYDEIWANLEAIYRRPPEGEA